MSTRTYPFPVLEQQEGAADRQARPPYRPDAGFYRSEAFQASSSGETVVTVTHSLSGSNLVTELIGKGSAGFGVSVCSPETMFRKFYRAPEPQAAQQNGGQLAARQEVRLQAADINGAIYVRGVVFTGSKVKVVATDAHGLMPQLIGSSFSLPRGAVIAAEDMHAFGVGSLSSLFVLVKSNVLKSGQMKVVANVSDDYRFKVHAGSKLYRQVSAANGPAEKAHAHSICVHALGRALDILREEKLEHDWWKSYPSLRWLADTIRALDCPLWYEEGFRSDEVATAVRQHEIHRRTDQQ